jgi:hypothetical protein
MFNWNDPDTFWLNITDIVLGIVTLACLAFVGQAIFREVYARLAKRLPAATTETPSRPDLAGTRPDDGRWRRTRRSRPQDGVT